VLRAQHRTITCRTRRTRPRIYGGFTRRTLLVLLRILTTFRCLTEKLIKEVHLSPTCPQIPEIRAKAGGAQHPWNLLCLWKIHNPRTLLATLVKTVFYYLERVFIAPNAIITISVKAASKLAGSRLPTNLATESAKSSTLIFWGFEDLNPLNEKVSPEFSPGGLMRNWTVEGGSRQEKRRLHKNNSHTRFLATGIEPGHYAVTFILSICVSDDLTSAHKQQLRSTGKGQLRAFAGIPKNRKQVCNERYIENEHLKDKLFSQTGSHAMYIAAEDSAESMELSGVLHVESTSSGTTEMGFLLQWSDVKFSKGNLTKPSSRFLCSKCGRLSHHCRALFSPPKALSGGP
jgi:hypothetical protein